MRVVLTDVAEADLSAIYANYLERSGPAADQVLGTILRAINGLALLTRERLVTRYPYRIVYHIDEAHEVVEVWRVLHGAQNWPP